MASHRLKRSMRGALAASAVAAAAMSLPAAPAVADPQLPANASDAARQVGELSHQAESLTEDYKKAVDDHNAKKAELDRSNAEASQAEQVANRARAEEEKFRVQVDRLANASYEGARLNKLSALMASESPQSFLDRASALDGLARDSSRALNAFAGAANQAQAAEKRSHDARARAAAAEADALRIQNDIGRKKADMDNQIRAVKQSMAKLNKDDRKSLLGDGITNFLDPGAAGKAGAAVRAALAEQGKAYVYGAKGPNTFDCSGLMQFAYAKAGVSIGGSTKSQVSEGRSVSASELQPGDLIFFYSGPSHVGMYVGNGKVVHAPTEGDVVKVADYKTIGNVTAIRRVAG